MCSLGVTHRNPSRVPLTLRLQTSRRSLRSPLSSKLYSLHNRGESPTTQEPLTEDSNGVQHTPQEQQPQPPPSSESPASVRRDPMPPQAGHNTARENQGRILLLCVAVLWGSYSPALKIAFSGAQAPDPATLTFLKNMMSAAALHFLAALPFIKKASAVGAGSGHSGGKSTKPAARAGAAGKAKPGRGLAGPGLASLLNWTASSPLLAGLELGLWTFCGGALQAVGIGLTTASRAGFLIQTISVMVPLIAALGGESVTGATWAGCILGIAGAALILRDGAAAAAAGVSTSGAAAGDFFVLAACAAYALGTVRLTKYASQIDSVELAANRQVAMALFSCVWVVSGAWAALRAGLPLSTLWPGYADPASWMLVLYVALVTGALSSLLQTLGQARVGSAQAQVIYSSTPLWSAVFASLLIGSESLGTLGYVGGGLIIAGGLVSAIPPSFLGLKKASSEGEEEKGEA